MVSEPSERKEVSEKYPNVADVLVGDVLLGADGFDWKVVALSGRTDKSVIVEAHCVESAMMVCKPRPIIRRYKLTTRVCRK